MATRFLKISVTAAFMLLTCAQTYAQDYTSDAKKTYNIIRYANAVGELSDAYTKPLADYQRVLTVADQNMSQIGQNKEVQPIPVNCNDLWVNNNDLDAYRSKMDAVQPFEQKSNIDFLVNDAQKSTQKVSVWCEKINSFFNQGQYKNESTCASVYAVLKDSLVFSVRQAVISWDIASQAAVHAANEAEIALLRYNKRAEFVVPMKTDITAFKELLNMFGYGTFNFPQIRQKTQSFAGSVNYDMDLSGKNLSKLSNSSYQTVYQDFYRYCSSGASSIELLTLKLEQNADPQEIQSIYAQVRSAYSSAINAYNTFVKQ